MEFQVMDGIPLPAKKGRAPKYPFEGLDVGQSFLAKSEPPHRLRTAASRWAKQLGRKFAVRKVEGGTMVWRTA